MSNLEPVKVAVFLCDLTGNMARPWADSGVTCYCVDVQHSIRQDRVEGNIHYVWGDARSWRPPDGVRVIFGAAFPPCTDVASSGARDFERKGGYLLRDALELFEACRQALAWSGAPYMVENPVGVLSSIPHIGRPDHFFEPWQYAGWCEDDNYTKKTAIWSGNGFVMPRPLEAPHLGPPDNRIHRASQKAGRSDLRSATPLGFARAVFSANARGVHGNV